MHCIAIAAESGGTVTVQQYSGSEYRFNPHNQCILICEDSSNSTKHSK